MADAERQFTRALQYTPRYAYLHVNIAIVQAALGRPAEAERHFLEAKDCDPTDPVSYRDYARWLASVGRRDEALVEARRAVELGTGDIDAQALLRTIESGPRTPHVQRPVTAEQWVERSLADYRAGRYEDCIEASGHAVALRPDYPEALNNMCAAEIALKRYSDAIPSCERAIALKPDFQLAKNNLAEARSKIGAMR